MRTWCREKLGVTPSDLALFRQALRHVSAVAEDRPDLPDNERLEFLGDAILDAIIGDLLFATYPDKGEGFLTRMRSKLVSRTQLNTLAKHIQIEKVMESNVARSHESSVPGNALEALIGALFLDKGFDRTRKVVVRLLTTYFDLKEIEKEDRDGKSRLLEWGQKRRKKVEFVVREEGGNGRGKHYVAEVRINGEVRGTGHGASKKVAEQDAAQSAFRGMRSRKPQPPRSLPAKAAPNAEHAPSMHAARRSQRPARPSRPEEPSNNAG
ncbi:MAG: ribonuclease III [Flavobacteriales bacterium]|nr:ribonuclease III [Flavobacteriales bacterium]